MVRQDTIPKLYNPGRFSSSQNISTMKEDWAIIMASQEGSHGLSFKSLLSINSIESFLIKNKSQQRRFSHNVSRTNSLNTTSLLR